MFTTKLTKKDPVEGEEQTEAEVPQDEKPEEEAEKEKLLDGVRKMALSM